MDWRTVLSDSFVPPVLFFREKQLLQLIDRPETNFYCEGEKSTGKTVTALHFKYKTDSEKHKSIYIQCQRALNIQFIEAMMNEGVKLKWDEKKHPTLTVFKKFKQPRITLILDDIQKITHYKTFNNFLHDLYENAIANKKQVRFILIGTTSYRRFLKCLRDDVRSRLRLEYLYFPKYNAEELKTIFKQRLDLAGLEYEEGAVNFIAAKIMRLVTDIREGLKMLREVCEKICDDGRQKQPITLKLVEEMWEPHKINYWIDHLEGLYWHEKAILFCATKIALSKQKEKSPFMINPDLEVTTIEINKIYRKFCYEQGEKPLYPERVNYILKRLCDQDFLLRMDVVSYGRRGRTTKYLYALDPETIYKVFKKTEGWT